MSIRGRVLVVDDSSSCPEFVRGGGYLAGGRPGRVGEPLDTRNVLFFVDETHELAEWRRQFWTGEYRLSLAARGARSATLTAFLARAAAPSSRKPPTEAGLRQAMAELKAERGGGGLR